MVKEYDFVVVGGGSAGYAAARTACDEGLSTVVIEGGAKVGGLCILRGCMPSKALIATANARLVMRNAERFALKPVTLPEVDGTAVVERKRRYVDEFAEYREEQLKDKRFDFIRGWAYFCNEHEITVKPLEEGEEAYNIRGKTILLATGSDTTEIDIPGLASTPHLSSDDILECTDLPKTAIVLGGGAIAVEMAHYLDGVGTEVTLIQRSPHLLSDLDADVADVVLESFRARGIHVYTGTQLQKLEDLGDVRRVHFMHGDTPKMVEADKIVYALGRSPATLGMGLEELGIKMERRRVITRLTQQVQNFDHIFAAGDISSALQVVHVAVLEGEIAARNAARLIRGETDGWEEMHYRNKLFGVFCEPQAAVVGMTENEARELQQDVAVATYPFNDHGKSLVSEHHEGFVKLIVDKADGRILGGACVGAEAVELIHEVSVAIEFRATAAQFAKVPHYHPTLSEIWTYPAEELAHLG